MDFELSREEFKKLPKNSQTLAIYDNIMQVKKDVKDLKKQETKEGFKFILIYLWLFVVTVYIGLKKFIPVI